MLFTTFDHIEANCQAEQPAGPCFPGVCCFGNLGGVGPEVGAEPYLRCEYREA